MRLLSNVIILILLLLIGSNLPLNLSIVDIDLSQPIITPSSEPTTEYYTATLNYKETNDEISEFLEFSFLNKGFEAKAHEIFAAKSDDYSLIVKQNSESFIPVEIPLSSFTPDSLGTVKISISDLIPSPIGQYEVLLTELGKPIATYYMQSLTSKPMLEFSSTNENPNTSAVKLFLPNQDYSDTILITVLKPIFTNPYRDLYTALSTGIQTPVLANEIPHSPNITVAGNNVTVDLRLTDFASFSSDKISTILKSIVQTYTSFSNINLTLGIDIKEKETALTHANPLSSAAFILDVDTLDYAHFKPIKVSSPQEIIETINNHYSLIPLFVKESVALDGSKANITLQHSLEGESLEILKAQLSLSFYSFEDIKEVYLNNELLPQITIINKNVN